MSKPRAGFVEFWTKDDGSKVCLTCGEYPIKDKQNEAEHLVRYHGWRRRKDGIVEYPQEDFEEFLKERGMFP